MDNLLQVECATFEDVLLLYNFGVKNKAMGSHKLNLSSSRSHTLFTIQIERIGEDSSPVVSKL